MNAGNLKLIVGAGLAGLVLAGSAAAQAPTSAQTERGEFGQYLAASPAEEAAMARSAAPSAISASAEVLVLGAHGYERAAAGANGFVCLVERSWASDFGDAEFWNPRIRGPICLNPAAVRSVLPDYLKRTQWVMAGLAQAEMAAKARQEGAAPVEIGAMAYMMSPQGYLSDAGKHWRPHLMFFVPHVEPGTWGAGLPDSPVMGGGGSDPVSVFFVPVAHWSDGSDAPMHMS